MGKLVVTEFISLDGVIEAPGGGEGYAHAGWSFKFNRGDEGDRFKYDELMASDAQLLGRVTYRVSPWPGRRSPATRRLRREMNSMPKYVASRTLTAADATWTNRP